MPTDHTDGYTSDVWLSGLAQDMPEEDRVTHTRWVVNCHRDGDSLTPVDVEALRILAEDGNPGVRAPAVDFLCHRGPVAWEDLARWGLDPDGDVRQSVFWAMEHTTHAAGRLAEEDPERWAALVAASAERYGEMPEFGCGSFTDHHPARLAALWPHLGRLLDLGHQDLNSSIISGCLEDALAHGAVRPGDAHLQAWIHGDSLERKMALLSVVQWFGLREEWQREIAEALSQDANPIVAETARTFLAGRGVPDIQSREWAAEGDRRS